MRPVLRKLNVHYDQLMLGTIPSDYLAKSSSAKQYIRVKNLKLYISRYRKKLLSAKTIAQREKWLQKIEDFEKELNQLI